VLLWLVSVLGWLPALMYAFPAFGAGGPTPVVSAAGPAGLRAGLALAASLLILSGAYGRALRSPPSARRLAAACFSSLLVALALPVLFSADVYAYAYYGDLALHGHNPYAHDPAPRGDPLAAAAVAAWDGHIPPRCVYGPVAVAIAALADLAGADGGVAGMIFAQRIAAALAYALAFTLTLRLVPSPRSRAALLLNPVVIWSVAEGHNDAAMLAFVFAGLASSRARPLCFALAALVKVPALVLWTRLKGGRSTWAATAIVALGYAPLAVAVALAPPAANTGGAAAWQSPLGLAAAVIGRLPAIALAVIFLGGVIIAARRLTSIDQAPALALAAWFALPNAYPWYALWIVPIAARNVSSTWARALITASLAAPARAVTDAVYAASDGERPGTFHPVMITLEYLPPLLVVVWAMLRRRAAGGLLTMVAVAALALPADAQTGPSTPSATSTPAPISSAGTVVPTPAAPTTNPPAPLPAAAPPPATSPPTAAPPATAPPSATPAPVITPAAVPPTAPPATPTPTPNPFSYIINPSPVPATTPDGPHILQVDLNDRHIRAGGPLIVRVVTSANVVGVEARALGRFIAIPQSQPGLFALSYTMPDMIPFWLLNKNYDIVIAAATADGRQTTVTFPMLLTR
jgi:hypothetical protein